MIIWFSGAIFVPYCSPLSLWRYLILVCGLPYTLQMKSFVLLMRSEIFLEDKVKFDPISCELILMHIEDHHRVPSNPSFDERVRLVDINNNSGIKNGSGNSTEWEVKFDDIYNALLPFLAEMIHQSCATTPGLQKYDKEMNAKNGTQHESYFWLKPKALIFDFLLDIPCILRTLITDQQHTKITLIGYSPGPVTWAFRSVD